MTATGDFVRSFGHRDDVGHRQPDRISATNGDGTFWTAPPHGDADFVLEQWNIEGKLLRRLNVAADWLPRGGYDISNDPSEPKVPEYDMLHLDDEGLLWVVVVVRDARWRQVDASERARLGGELYDARLLVIDPGAGVILASYLHDSPELPLPPFSRFVRGTSLGYRTVRDSLGLQAVEIYDVGLIGW